MIKDYHMHPKVVLDPSAFDLYAQRALAQGIEEVCITDHMPLSTSCAKDRIPAGQVEAYCQQVQKIKEKYKGHLSVRLGIEIDYHPAFTKEIEAVLSAGDYDFVIGATHLHVGQSDIFALTSTHNQYAAACLENTILAAESGYFNAIAHIDLYRWIFTLPQRFPLEDDHYEDQNHLPLIHKTLSTIKAQNLLLEINVHQAAHSNDLSKIYPSPFILEQALSMDIGFYYGSDAHYPQEVGAMLPTLRSHPLYGKAIQKWEELDL